MTLRLFATLLLASVTAHFSPAAADIISLSPPYPSYGSVERLDPALDALLRAEAHLEKLAEGFNWAEGPAWMPQQRQLVFSDVPENIIYRWREGYGIDIFLRPSGFTGDNFAGRQPGSNGLTIDLQGNLVICQHGDRRIARLNDDRHTFSTVADNYQGHLFNSPNDLVYDRQGNFYFTDPLYGMQDNSESEMGFYGVYRVTPGGTVTLVTRDLERPNGLALSPDEKTLYVSNSYRPRSVIVAYTLGADGLPIDAGRALIDTSARVERGLSGLNDGMAMDQQGNLWATGPGGVLVITPEGKHLGTLLTGVSTGNCTWGDDGSTLYVTCDGAICRIRTNTKGVRF